MEILILAGFEDVLGIKTNSVLALPIKVVSIWKADGKEFIGMRGQPYLCLYIENVFLA